MLICNKNIKENNDDKLIFLNQPISGTESDWIGVTSYVNKLEEAKKRKRKISLKNVLKLFTIMLMALLAKYIWSRYYWNIC